MGGYKCKRTVNLTRIYSDKFSIKKKSDVNKIDVFLLPSQIFIRRDDLYFHQEETTCRIQDDHVEKMIHDDWMHRDYQSDLSLRVTWGNTHDASVIFLDNRYTLPNYERNPWQVQPSNLIARYVNEINSAFDDWLHCLIPAARVCVQEKVEYSL